MEGRLGSTLRGSTAFAKREAPSGRFVTAQLTGDPQLASNVSGIAAYARRSIPFAMGVGFVAGLTSDGVFGKLLGLDVARTTGLDSKAPHA